MKLFIDTANVNHIREMHDLGIISGATTNPTLIAREGKDFNTTIAEILKIFSDDAEAQVFGEVISLEFKKMVEEAEKLASLSKKMVVKIPMCAEGLKTARYLKGKGIRTLITLVFNPAQAILAAYAGATYIAPFIGRLDDIGVNGCAVVEDICATYKVQGIETKVLCASLKNPQQVYQAARAGSECLTIPYSVLKQCIHHPLSQEGINMFLDDWAGLQKKLNG